jgi:hypothetical protein
MLSVGSRGLGPRRALVLCGLGFVTGCFESAVTDFYEEPSAIVGASGSSATSGDGGAAPRAGEGGSAGRAGGSAGSSVAGSGGDGARAGTDSAGAGSGTGSSGGATTTAGSGTGGGQGGDDGSGGTSSPAGRGGDGGSAGSISCEAYGAAARDFDRHCYLFVAADVTFREAVDACEERGAHLVTLSSENRTRSEFQSENAFVWELGSKTPVWIAATDGKSPLEHGDGTYYGWITGEAMSFDAWSDAQPNNSAAACQDDRPCSCDEGTCYEHCGFQWSTAAKDGSLPGWNDRLCEHRIAYVCEWDEP